VFVSLRLRKRPSGIRRQPRLRPHFDHSAAAAGPQQTPDVRGTAWGSYRRTKTGAARVGQGESRSALRPGLLPAGGTARVGRSEVRSLTPPDEKGKALLIKLPSLPFRSVGEMAIAEAAARKGNHVNSCGTN